jgi:hypothetical protein
MSKKEKLVRERLGDQQVDQLLKELGLDPRKPQTWVSLERMSVW